MEKIKFQFTIDIEEAVKLRSLFEHWSDVQRVSKDNHPLTPSEEFCDLAVININSQISNAGYIFNIETNSYVKKG